MKNGRKILISRIVQLPVKIGLETEMMIYASKRGYTVMSVDVPYRDRPEGSKSKVNAIRDGIHIVNLIVKGKLQGVGNAI